ncbi:MAG: recombinase, partial [Thermoplasmata archaeon]|nr:recombinase [Thermoplasmata archaeon]
TILVTGDAGVGKTVLGIQFIVKQCEQGKRCALLATEESPDDLRAQALGFGWDLMKYEDEQLLKIHEVLERRMIEARFSDASESSAEVHFKDIANYVPENVTNVVIDNIGVYALGMPIEKFREQLDLLVYMLGKKGCTSLIICDDAVGEQYNNIAMYSTYGAIWMFRRENAYTSRRERLIEIRKMRSTAVPLDYLPFEISGGGIKILKSSWEEK